MLANASPTPRRMKTLNTGLYLRLLLVRFVPARPCELYCHTRPLVRVGLGQHLG